jgi:hypothetical protein
MAFPVIGLLGGGAVAVAAAAEGGTPNSAPQPTNIGPQGGVLMQPGAAAPGASVPDLLTQVGGIQIGVRPPKVSRGVAGLLAVYAAELPTNAAIDPEIQAKVDQLEEYGEQAYNSLSDKAKAAGANYLNEKYDLDPPLNGTESWTEIGKRIAGPIGEDAGQAAGEAIAGPAGGIVGEKLGAYLGVKIDDFLNQHADDIKQWFVDRYQSVKNWVEGTAQEAYDDVVDWVGGWF